MIPASHSTSHSLTAGCSRNAPGGPDTSSRLFPLSFEEEEPPPSSKCEEDADNDSFVSSRTVPHLPPPPSSEPATSATTTAATAVHVNDHRQSSSSSCSGGTVVVKNAPRHPPEVVNAVVDADNIVSAPPSPPPHPPPPPQRNCSGEKSSSLMTPIPSSACSCSREGGGGGGGSEGDGEGEQRKPTTVGFSADSKEATNTSSGSSSSNLLGNCGVCGGKADGNFFSAVVCLPCKSFFIRCTKDGEASITRQCSGCCDVTEQLRNRCQFCRFQRCLAVGMTRKEKPEVILAEEGQVLCQVCGDLPNGVHFGVTTCEGCKKFFRRGLKEHESYVCHASKNCAINPRNRNNCRYCRFQKCIAAGMSRNAIKMGRPRKSASKSGREDGAPEVLDTYTEGEVTVTHVQGPSSGVKELQMSGQHGRPGSTTKGWSAGKANWTLPQEAAVTSDAPFSSAVRSNAPFSSAVRNDAPFSSAVRSDAPFSSADRSDAPFSSAVRSDAPFTSAVRSEAPFSSAVRSDAPFSSAARSDAPFSFAVRSNAPFTSTSASCLLAESLTQSQSPSLTPGQVRLAPRLLSVAPGAPVSVPAVVCPASTQCSFPNSAGSSGAMNPTLLSSKPLCSSQENFQFYSQKMNTSTTTTYTNSDLSSDTRSSSSLRMFQEAKNVQNTNPNIQLFAGVTQGGPASSVGVVRDSSSNGGLDRSLGVITAQADFPLAPSAVSGELDILQDDGCTSRVKIPRRDDHGMFNHIVTTSGQQQTREGAFPGLETMAHNVSTTTTVVSNYPFREASMDSSTNKQAWRNDLIDKRNTTCLDQAGPSSQWPRPSAQHVSGLGQGQSDCREHNGREQQHGQMSSQQPGQSSGQQLLGQKSGQPVSSGREREQGQGQDLALGSTNSNIAGPAFTPYMNEEDIFRTNAVFASLSTLMEAAEGEGRSPWDHSSSCFSNSDGGASAEVAMLENLMQVEHQYSPQGSIHYWKSLASSTPASSLGLPAEMPTRCRQLLESTLAVFKEYVNSSNHSKYESSETANKEWPHHSDSEAMKKYWSTVQARIVRGTQSGVTYAYRVPGMESVHPNDKNVLVNKKVVFSLALLNHSTVFFDGEQQDFKHFFNWKLNHKNPVAVLRQHLLSVGRKIFDQQMDLNEVALIFALNIFCLEKGDFADQEAVDQAKNDVLMALTTYLFCVRKMSRPNVRMLRLFSLMPRMRLMGVWMTDIMKNLKFDTSLTKIDINKIRLEES